MLRNHLLLPGTLEREKAWRCLITPDLKVTIYKNCQSYMCRSLFFYSCALITFCQNIAPSPNNIFSLQNVSPWGQDIKLCPIQYFSFLILNILDIRYMSQKTYMWKKNINYKYPVCTGFVQTSLPLAQLRLRAVLMSRDADLWAVTVWQNSLLWAASGLWHSKNKKEREKYKEKDERKYKREKSPYIMQFQNISLKCSLNTRSLDLLTLVIHSINRYVWHCQCA